MRSFVCMSCIADLPDRQSVICDRIPGDFICTICHDLMENAVSCREGHNFCSSCISKCLRKVCPHCRAPTSTDALTQNRAIRNLICELGARCFYDQCDWIGKYGQLNTHLSLDCRFTPCKCPNHDCDQKIQRQHINDHVATCVFRLVSCSQCGDNS